MFEIKCIVADKKVVEVLQLLNGHTLEPPVCVPVQGAKTNGHAVEMAKSRGAHALLLEFIKGRKQTTSTELKHHLMNKGFSSNGYSYTLKKLLKEGHLKTLKRTHGQPTILEVRNG